MTHENFISLIFTYHFVFSCWWVSVSSVLLLILIFLYYLILKNFKFFLFFFKCFLISVLSTLVIFKAATQLSAFLTSFSLRLIFVIVKGFYPRLLCCFVGLIIFFSQLLEYLWVCHMFEWIGAVCVWTLLLFVICRYCKPSFPPGKENKEVNWNDLNSTGCGGQLISMLFLPSVNFDYGEMPVMAFLFFLSFSHSLITRCGQCGGVDWELQSALFTHSWLFGLAVLWLQDTPTRSHTHMRYVSLALTHAHRHSAKPISILKSPYLC